MSKKKIIRYIIYKHDYSHRTERADGTLSSWRNFERAKTMRQAEKKARRMGDGAIIQQLYRRKSGALGVREWGYTND